MAMAGLLCRIWALSSGCKTFVEKQCGFLNQCRRNVLGMSSKFVQYVHRKPFSMF
jgi:hypothetical protein